MHPVVESKRYEVADLCRRYGVKRLEVFGSAAREDFDEATSDVDLLVEFADRPVTGGLATYFGLKDALEHLFLRDVDLVEVGALRNPYVRADIERHKQLLYGA